MPATQAIFKDTVLFGKKVLAVNISKTYPFRHDADGRGSTYECARKFWKVSLKRAESVDYVLAISEGKAVALYRPVRWIPSAGEPGKYEFEGEKVRENPMAGVNVESVFAGRSNPVKYFD